MDSFEPNSSSGFFDKIAPGGAYFKYSRLALIFLGIILLTLIINILLPYLSKKSLFTTSPTPAPASGNVPRPPIAPLPKGFQSWTFSHGEGVTGPKIQTATVDTLTPPKGTTQNVTIAIKNDSPVTIANATIYTDNTNKTYPMKLVKGTETDGTWAGTWKIDDTYNYIYYINFDLESSTGNWSGGLTFR